MRTFTLLSILTHLLPMGHVFDNADFVEQVFLNFTVNCINNVVYCSDCVLSYASIQRQLGIWHQLSQVVGGRGAVAPASETTDCIPKRVQQSGGNAQRKLKFRTGGDITAVPNRWWRMRKS